MEEFDLDGLVLVGGARTDLTLSSLDVMYIYIYSIVNYDIIYCIAIICIYLLDFVGEECVD